MMNNGNDARCQNLTKLRDLGVISEDLCQAMDSVKGGGEAMSSNKGVCGSSTDKGVVVTLGGV